MKWRSYLYEYIFNELDTHAEMKGLNLKAI